MARGRQHERGNALIEFTLVGIPLIFILISIFEISRGMWIYNTLAYAAKDAARYAAVRGQQWAHACSGVPDCPPTIATLAARFQHAGVGLLPDKVEVTFTSATRSINCNPLNSCLANATPFPSETGGAELDGGTQGLPVTITARYPFQSAIAMFWPGAGGSIVFGTKLLPATARERIMF
jgi:hypothetical protein